MAAGYLFALVPTLAILTGGVIALARVIRRPRPEEFLLLGIVALPVLLLIYYSLKIPVYASAKAFYASAAVAPVCVLGALGWDWLAAQARVLRLVLYVAAGIWGMNSYAMFWIRGESSATQILTARNLADQQLHEQALLQLSAVLQSAPGNAAAAALASTELLEVGQVTQAAAMATQATQAAPGDPDCHLALAAVLVRQGKLDEAVLETQRATELAPDSPIAFDKLSERLYALGRRAEAVTACREALRVYPANEGPALPAGFFGVLGPGRCHQRRGPLPKLAVAIDRAPPPLWTGWRGFSQRSRIQACATAQRRCAMPRKPAG